MILKKKDSGIRKKKVKDKNLNVHRHCQNSVGTKKHRESGEREADCNWMD